MNELGGRQVICIKLASIDKKFCLRSACGDDEG